MPVDINTQSGLSNAFTSVGGTQRFATGYPIGTAPAAIINNAIGGKTLTADYFPSDLPKFHFSIVQNEWSTATSVLTPERLFKLPLPTPLVDAQEVNYEQNFNYLGVLNRFLENPAGRGLQAVTGITVNTFKTITMSAPDYRTFQFSWKFSPKNYQESVTIQKIIYALKKAAAPKKAGGITGNTGKFLLRFPKIFSLYFFPNVQFMFKFKPCVLTTISVDYAGGNPFPAFYREEGGNMANSPTESVTLSTNWLELEYWLDNNENANDSDFKIDPNIGLPTNDAFDAWNYYTYDSSKSQQFQQPKAEPQIEKGAPPGLDSPFKRPPGGQLGEE